MKKRVPRSPETEKQRRQKIFALMVIINTVAAVMVCGVEWRFSALMLKVWEWLPFTVLAAYISFYCLSLFFVGQWADKVPPPPDASGCDESG